MIERTTVRLPEALLARARKKAAQEGRTLTSLIEEGLMEVLTKQVQPAKSASPQIRTSLATGGRNPDYAHMTFQEIETMEDIEKLQRIEKAFKEQS